MNIFGLDLSVGQEVIINENGKPRRVQCHHGFGMGHENIGSKIYGWVPPSPTAFRIDEIIDYPRTILLWFLDEHVCPEELYEHRYNHKETGEHWPVPTEQIVEALFGLAHVKSAVSQSKHVRANFRELDKLTELSIEEVYDLTGNLRMNNLAKVALERDAEAQFNEAEFVESIRPAMEFAESLKPTPAEQTGTDDVTDNELDITLRLTIDEAQLKGVEDERIIEILRQQLEPDGLRRAIGELRSDIEDEAEFDEAEKELDQMNADEEPETVLPIWCTRCGVKGHISEHCHVIPDDEDDKRSTDKPAMCSRCGERTHATADCTTEIKGGWYPFID